MRLIRILSFIYKAEHPHFLSVDKSTYFRWKWLIKMIVSMNKNYKSCEILRKRYKLLEDFVVIGLKYNGKNVKRRTCGFAKEFLEDLRNPKATKVQIEMFKEAIKIAKEHPVEF